MNRYACLVAAFLSFAGCAGPTVAPSTAKITARASKAQTHIAVAKTESNEGGKRVASATTHAKASQVHSGSVAAGVDAARAALAAKNYAEADAQLVKVKAENVALMGQLNEVLADLEESRKNFDQVKLELEAADGEIEYLKLETDKLQVQVDRLASQASEDHAIAARCKSWFGLGAIFYGIEHLLKAGIVGILIFVAVVIALLCIGGPTAAAALAGIRWLWASLFRKSPP